jgi:general secretion pathway protein G
MTDKRKGFTLIELMVVIVIIGLLASFLLPQVMNSMRRSRVLGCATNLGKLWQLQTMYMAQFGGSMKIMSPTTGSEFWEMLSKTTPPLIDPDDRKLFLCPVKGEGIEGDIQYYGPGASVNRLAGADPVGCDDPENHMQGTTDTGSGNVLRKKGDVLELSGADWTNMLNNKFPPKR